MHFLLFVGSAAKQEKTPDEILGAAIIVQDCTGIVAMDANDKQFYCDVCNTAAPCAKKKF